MSELLYRYSLSSNFKILANIQEITVVVLDNYLAVLTLHKESASKHTGWWLGRWITRRFTVEVI